MEYNWKDWNLGGKIIFCSACVAIIALLMKWVDLGVFSQNGFAQQGYLLLPCWIYPLLVLFKDKKMNVFAGIIPSVIAIIIMITFISSKGINDEIFGDVVNVNVAAAGAWLFLFASVTLLIGVVKYIPVGELKASFTHSVNAIKGNVDRLRKDVKETVVHSEKPASKKSPSFENEEDAIKKLERLNDLKKSGILSEEEFNIEKKKLLTSLYLQFF